MRARYLTLLAAAFALVAVGPRPVDALSPEQAASYSYDQAKKMGFSSQDMEGRSWEDCMGQFRRPAQTPPPRPRRAQRGQTPEGRREVDSSKFRRGIGI